ncbi:MAG: winged helix-turn-helix domain-containing protein [Pyrinomonadaceae bacterium]
MAKKSDGDSPVKLRIKMSARSGESGSGQVVSQLRELIRGKQLKPGQVLPSEDGLAEQLGVGRKVVRYAYGKLVEEGLLVRDFPHNKRVAGGGSQGGAKKKAAAGKGSSRATAKKGGARGGARKK